MLKLHDERIVFCSADHVCVVFKADLSVGGISMRPENPVRSALLTNFKPIGPSPPEK